MSALSGRLIALGDIHGCVHALDAVLEAIRPTSDDHLVILGDFIDQGRDSKDVIERLIALGELCPMDVIQGNHEEMLLAARTSEPALRYWENCGGVQIHILDRSTFKPLLTGLAVLCALHRLGGNKFAWRTEEYEFVADIPAIDLLTGSDRVRLAIEREIDPHTIHTELEKEAAGFRAQRVEYLRYT